MIGSCQDCSSQHHKSAASCGGVLRFLPVYGSCLLLNTLHHQAAGEPGPGACAFGFPFLGKGGVGWRGRVGACVGWVGCCAASRGTSRGSAEGLLSSHRWALRALLFAQPCTPWPPAPDPGRRCWRARSRTRWCMRWCTPACLTSTRGPRCGSGSRARAGGLKKNVILGSDVDARSKLWAVDMWASLHALVVPLFEA